MNEAAVVRARRRAVRAYPRSKAHQNTYVRGAMAKLSGRPADACPYARDPRKTWRAGYRKAWMSGHSSA